jgi:hypothetical protein
MNKTLKKLYLLSMPAALFLASPALAASDSPTIKVPSNGPSVDTIITGAINILLWVAGIASVIVIIVGGIMFIVSGGDENTTKRARSAILYAIIGLVITLLAFAIVNFVLGRL